MYYFGSALSSELDSQEGKNSKETSRKRERVFNHWMDNNSKPSEGPKFRDPAARE